MSRTWSRRTKMDRWDNPDKGHNKLVSSEEFSTCVKKTGVYRHESEALKAIEKLEVNPNYPAHWRAYKCPFCKKWHLTSGKNTL